MTSITELVNDQKLHFLRTIMTNKFALMRSIIMCIVFSAFRTVHVYPTLTI